MNGMTLTYGPACRMELNLFSTRRCWVLYIVQYNNFSVNLRVDHILSLCSQMIYLLKRLRDQEPDLPHLGIQ